MLSAWKDLRRSRRGAPKRPILLRFFSTSLLLKSMLEKGTVFSFDKPNRCGASQFILSLRSNGRPSNRLGMQPWALSLPDKELCLRGALAVCTPLAPEPSAQTWILALNRFTTLELLNYHKPLFLFVYKILGQILGLLTKHNGIRDQLIISPYFHPIAKAHPTTLGAMAAAGTKLYYLYLTSWSLMQFRPYYVFLFVSFFCFVQTLFFKLIS